MTEGDAATIRTWLATLAAADPARRRFGAGSHRYQLRPPLSAERAAVVAERLGDALSPWHRGWLTALGDGGAGPYHGLFPLDHPQQLALAEGSFDPRAPGRALYRGVVGLGHLGCGQLALLIVGGPHRGQVWLDARASGGGVVPVAANVETYVAAWLRGASENQLPPPACPPGACPLPRALSTYLAAIERDRALPAGSLDGEPLTAALGALSPGAIRVAASGDDPFFATDAALAVCVACEVMLEHLGRRGLARDRVQPGENWPTEPGF